MFSPYYHLALYWLNPITVLALNIPTNRISINEPSSLVLTNTTGLNKPVNTAILTEPEIHCKASLAPPRISSCLDALAQIPIDARSVIVEDPAYSYGPRGQGNFDVGLPVRWISCTYIFPFTLRMRLRFPILNHSIPKQGSQNTLTQQHGSGRRLHHRSLPNLLPLSRQRYQHTRRCTPDTPALRRSWAPAVGRPGEQNG